MRPPRLNRHLVLEALVSTPDGAGGFSQSWQTLGMLYGEIQAGGGREGAGEELRLTTTSARILLRASALEDTRYPKPGQRLREGTRLWRIITVSEADLNGLYLQVFAQEEVLS